MGPKRGADSESVYVNVPQLESAHLRARLYASEINSFKNITEPTHSDTYTPVFFYVKPHTHTVKHTTHFNWV